MHGPRNSLEESALKGLALFASVAMLLCSGYLNAKFATSKAQTTDAAIVYATIGIAAEVFCFTLPFFFIPALRRLQLFRAGVGMVIWGVCIAFSAQSAIGHVAGSRFEALSGRMAASTSYQDTREELKRARERMSWLPRPTEASGAIQAKIKNQQGNMLFVQTNECANQWTPVAKTFCKALSELTSGLTNALEYEKLDKRITELQAKSDAAGGAHVNILTEGADPQATALGKWFGVDVATMQGLLSLGVAALLLLASLVPYAILGGEVNVRKPPKSPKEPPPAALATEGGLLLDMSPGPAQALTRAPTAYIAPPRDLEPGGKELLRAIGMPEAPCDRREKDSRDVLGWRFYAYLVATKHVGDHSADDIDMLYEAFSISDNRVAWGMRIVKSELEGIGQRYVSSGLRVKEDGSRGTVWAIKPIAYSKLLDLLRKRGIVTETPKAPEPVEAVQEPVAEATPPTKNVYRLFGRVTDPEAKKASG